ncbi:putative mediator of RNA polymerase II transcription subunit 12 [Selaginella moellendorffii]|uniref:putative mediator of RNA polymerase II transcription subunit 12 n=1 Tax=Selaginella moellendorffii TaxID=88036 RepID=UPI000D1C934A|nr:putative mediator of RNA polymerase II transcription subunit 12 [Selaginella moellendorffii]|eukprot:XP_024532290.1 putative mediator of RNA polymerase II transcription subunit 12 [Selaginella moellendorffii]
MSMDSITGSQFLSNLSQCSSPRLESDQMSIKSEDENGAATKVKLMCSYGGRIMMRPHDSQLRYIGGDTRILVVPRTISYADFCVKLAKICGGRSVLPKYKLPYEDFDALVSVIGDDDLEAMLEEYERLDAKEAPSKLRLFLFPKIPSTAAAIAGQIPTSSLRFDSRNEQSFLDVLNNTIQQTEQPDQQQVVSDVPDFLFGLEVPGSISMQEVIAAADGPGSAVAKKIMEADSAMQSELTPICTNPRKIDSNPPQPRQYDPPAAADAAGPKPRPVSPFLAPSTAISSADPIYTPQIQQARAPPIQQQLPIGQSPNPQNISSQQQILPPRGPKKDKNSSPKKLEPKTGPRLPPEDSKLSHVDKQSNAATAMDAPSSASSPGVEGMEALTLVKAEAAAIAEKSNADEDSKVVGHDSPKSSSQDNTLPMKGSLNLKEMSLNQAIAFQQQQQQQQPEHRIAATRQEFQQQVLQQQNFIHHHQQQPQVVYYNQQQQPYIIENNMVYFLTDQQQQAMHYIQRPVHVNQQQAPIQIQRGGSDPLRQQPQQQQQQVMQRQLSAAYVDQMKQQQQQQQIPRMMFPAVNSSSPAQAPIPVSTIPLPVSIPIPQQFAPGLEIRAAQQQQQGFVRPIDQAGVVLVSQQPQMPYTPAP